MLQWAEAIMASLGYFGIALLMFLEVVIPPIPSEVILPLGGFSAARGSLNLFGVVVAATFGAAVGAVALYYVGKLLGTERLVKFANRYGRWLTISGKEVRQATAWFDRFGNAVVFFCRFVPGIRSLISLPAGVAQMKLLPFLVLTIVGSLIWNFILTYAGFLLGANYEAVDKAIGSWGKYVLLGIVAILGIWYVIRLVKQMREKPEEEAASSTAQQSWSPDSQQNMPSWALEAQQQQNMPGWDAMAMQQQGQQQNSMPGWGQQGQQGQQSMPGWNANAPSLPGFAPATHQPGSLLKQGSATNWMQGQQNAQAGPQFGPQAGNDPDATIVRGSASAASWQAAQQQSWGQQAQQQQPAQQQSWPQQAQAPQSPSWEQQAQPQQPAWVQQVQQSQQPAQPQQPAWGQQAQQPQQPAQPQQQSWTQQVQQQQPAWVQQAQQQSQQSTQPPAQGPGWTQQPQGQSWGQQPQQQQPVQQQSWEQQVQAQQPQQPAQQPWGQQPQQPAQQQQSWEQQVQAQQQQQQQQQPRGQQPQPPQNARW
jgi:membrane protein DedA with SNARE-associated domain